MDAFWAAPPVSRYIKFRKPGSDPQMEGTSSDAHGAGL